MQPIRRKIKLVIVLLAAAIAVSTLIYARGGFSVVATPEKQKVLLCGNGYFGSATAGKKVYQDYCASCHSMEKDATGPALMGVGNRITSDTLIRTFLLYPRKALKSSSYLQEVYYRYGKSAHPSFKDVMTEQEVKDVISFITRWGMF